MGWRRNSALSTLSKARGQHFIASDEFLKIGGLHVLNLVNVLGLECHRQGGYFKLLVLVLATKLECEVGMTKVRFEKSLEGGWGIGVYILGEW